MIFDPWLVIPGERLGGLRVGAEPKTAFARLGRPMYGDAAMQKSWSTWIGKGGGRIDLFVVNDHAGTASERRTIHVVRATSPRFHLVGGLHPGLSMRRMRAAYPQAVSVASDAKTSIWDDVRRGLAWQTAGDRVVALLVHDKGTPLDASVAPYVSTPLHRL